jgi:hypothetical protein
LGAKEKATIKVFNRAEADSGAKTEIRNDQKSSIHAT